MESPSWFSFDFGVGINLFDYILSEPKRPVLLRELFCVQMTLKLIANFDSMSDSRYYVSSFYRIIVPDAGPNAFCGLVDHFRPFFPVIGVKFIKAFAVQLVNFVSVERHTDSQVIVGDEDTVKTCSNYQ
jgi:hypothetical protein